MGFNISPHGLADCKAGLYVSMLIAFGKLWWLLDVAADEPERSEQRSDLCECQLLSPRQFEGVVF